MNTHIHRYTFLAIAALLVALVAMPTSASQCVKFDSLAAGAVWGSSTGHLSGDVVHVESGIRVSVHFFQYPGGGGTFNDAIVDTAWQTSSPNSINTNNINLGFDFAGLPSLPSQVAIKFRDLGGFENVAVNGSPIQVGELANGALPGVSWTVADFPTAGGRVGKLTVQGSIHSLLVGGQELWVDTLCVVAAPADGIDHYEVYDVEDLRIEAEVKLLGQFDREEPTAARVTALTHFANPVSKNGEGMVERNGHLSLYRIRQQEPEPGRSIGIRNQFGRQTLRLGDAVILAVPAEKIERGSELVRDLDHYKCYEAEGEPVTRVVTLRDQFGYGRGRVSEPRLFCVPVEKWHEEHFEIRNREAHLTFYALEAEGEARKITKRDQFGEAGLLVLRPEWLAVPTVKLFTAED